MARTGPKASEDLNLATRAAWLHYAGGHTQADVAKRLGITSVKAHRLINRANQEGAVKFIIDSDIAECISLETQLAERYNLEYCEVAPELYEEGDIPQNALGAAGAKFLSREIERNDVNLIGFGHGRTLSACVSQLPRGPYEDIQFVSLLGGLNRNFAANPHDVMHRLAAKTGASAYVMPVPLFANTVEDREVLLSQRGVSDVMRMAIKSDLKFVGLGPVSSDAQLITSGIIEKEEIEEVIAHGGVGELLGCFFNEAGQNIKTTLTDHTLSLELSDLQDNRIVAVAGGISKANAIGSVLRSGLLSGLITDERTASALINSN